ncbi:TIGR00730 family Rossman fold protein [bacterium]|nr:MAG: TIGR00730 family Rossman fold protein [bacterium]
MKKHAHRQVCAVLPPHVNENDLAWSTGQLESLFNIRKGGFSSRRLIKIMNEFISGYRFIRHYKKAVSVFGSARSGFGDKVYQDAAKLGFELASDGFAVITGGGPGIMEAANAGALKAGGESVGLNIQLPTEQRINKFVNESSSFHYFFTRKVMLASASQIYVFFPGGYGTMDELFEMLTLIQTKKVDPILIILVNKTFWKPMLKWVEQSMYEKNRAISKSDLSLFKVVADADEAVDLIRHLVARKKIAKHPRELVGSYGKTPGGIRMPKRRGKVAPKVSEIKITSQVIKSGKKTSKRSR